MNINQLVAIQLSVLRLDKNRTLEALVHDTGISMASMSRLENGKEEITISKAESHSR
ncbi:MAG: helix-turn-helix transcriptional regulator [Bacteroidetes bacterium]|nr:helix-turn-helix transcriptional regulator [Bacteroidota bacterium]